MSFTKLLIVLMLNSLGVYADKILAVFPTPSISHQVVFRPLVQELARRGHEVVVLTTDPAFSKGQTPTNLTEIDLHDLSYEMWRKHILATSTGKETDLYNQIKTILNLMMNIFEKQIQTKEVKNILEDKTKAFDLLLIEACVRPALAFSHVFKAPVIQVSSFGAIFDNYKIIGGPTHPLIYPNPINQKLYNLTIWEKIKELYNHYRLEFMSYRHEKEEHDMLKRNFGPNIPSPSKLSDNVEMLFLNVHPIWEGNFPVPPAVVYMGGIHQKPEKELPKDLKSYLDSSKRGVIYMSFGTNTNLSALPVERIQMFIKAFSELPYDILWKWDKDLLPGQSKNTRISKWLPQSDLLRHPNVKLFITQGGLQSTDEAITAGVPLIGIPMLGDQWYNVEKYVFHKIGKRLDLEAITKEKLKESIKTVIEDKSYRKNIERLRSLMRDQPQSALERAAWWVEHVLRHGGARHLRAPAANISWAQYLELELVAVLLLAVVVALILIFLILNYILRIFKSSLKLKVS